MIHLEILNTQEDITDQFERLFKFRGLNVPTNDISEYLATLILSRVRKRFLMQENPDGSKWPVTKSAAIRLRGGFTKAAGGKYAPGGLKTGTGSLFSSGNLFHSIQLSKRMDGEHAIETDVDYASKWQNDKYTIIGTDDDEILMFLNSAIERLL